jgi:prevent-host-death family protein
MLRVSIRELRGSIKEIMAAANRGETIKVTYRGEDYAQILPIKRKKVSVEDETFGMWKDYQEVGDVNEYIKKLRKGRDIC